jgi:hypothetical protein
LMYSPWRFPGSAMVLSQISKAFGRVGVAKNNLDFSILGMLKITSLKRDYIELDLPTA